MTPATQTIVEHGEASALPDTSWFWRRVLVFLVSIVCLYLAWLIAGKTTDTATLREIARNALWLVGICLFLYVAGASATDCVRLVTAFRSTRRETITTAPPPSTITAEGDVTAKEPTA